MNKIKRLIRSLKKGIMIMLLEVIIGNFIEYFDTKNLTCLYLSLWVYITNNDFKVSVENYYQLKKCYNATNI